MCIVSHPISQEEFQKSCIRLLSKNCQEKEFDEMVHALRTKFPLAQEWINWWMRADIMGMLFPAKLQMCKQVSEGIPESTNAQEAMHKTYYLIA